MTMVPRDLARLEGAARRLPPGAARILHDIIEWRQAGHGGGISEHELGVLLEAAYRAGQNLPEDPLVTRLQAALRAPEPARGGDGGPGYDLGIMTEVPREADGAAGT